MSDRKNIPYMYLIQHLKLFLFFLFCFVFILTSISKQLYKHQQQTILLWSDDINNYMYLSILKSCSCKMFFFGRLVTYIFHIYQQTGYMTILTGEYREGPGSHVWVAATTATAEREQTNQQGQQSTSQGTRHHSLYSFVPV